MHRSGTSFVRPDSLRRIQGRLKSIPPPAYLLLPRDEIEKKSEFALRMLRECSLCPRNCGVDRTSGERGFCETGDMPFVSSWGPHFGEERPLVGRRGSGTIFFSGCNLGCIFCQNWTISHGRQGEELSFEALSDVMLGLQDMGCHNINFVTPTHQMPMILRALVIAAGKGLSLPLVYNTGGYDSLHAVRLLDGIVDIYMPDFKYWDPGVARELSDAGDYPGAARQAVKEMHSQVGDLVVDKTGVARRGLLLRHLVLPGGLSGTRGVVEFIAGEISKNTYINIMDQYHPCYRAFGHPPLDRRITPDEFSEALKLAREAGLGRIDGITV